MLGSTINTEKNMIALSSHEPIYAQVANFYKEMINRGAIKEGEFLPSVREVAIAEGINPNTVEKSFTILVKDGYVTNVPKKGFYVSKKAISEDKISTLEKRLKDLLNDGYTLEEIKLALKQIKGVEND